MFAVRIIQDGLVMLHDIFETVTIYQGWPWDLRPDDNNVYAIKNQNVRNIDYRLFV